MRSPEAQGYVACSESYEVLAFYPIAADTQPPPPPHGPMLQPIFTKRGILEGTLLMN